MNRKRNVNYIRPEDPHFLKVLKKEAGYDDTNHKFDKLQNSEEDFVDDNDSESPQVVVLKEGDLTSEEAETEMERLKKEESENKADLSQRVIFKVKKNQTKKSRKATVNRSVQMNKNNLLSFADENSDTDT